MCHILQSQPKSLLNLAKQKYVYGAGLAITTVPKLYKCIKRYLLYVLKTVLCLFRYNFY